MYQTDTYGEDCGELESMLDDPRAARFRGGRVCHKPQGPNSCLYKPGDGVCDFPEVGNLIYWGYG